MSTCRAQTFYVDRYHSHLGEVMIITGLQGLISVVKLTVDDAGEVQSPLGHPCVRGELINTPDVHRFLVFTTRSYNSMTYGVVYFFFKLYVWCFSFHISIVRFTPPVIVMC